MNEEKIIKALNCCLTANCKECPFEDNCFDCGNIPVEVLRDILGLIHSQKEENEKLKEELAKWKLKCYKLYPKNNAYAVQVEASRKLEAEIKTEAIKEFAEKLREKIVNTPSDFPREIGTVAYINGSAHRQLEILDYLDNLIKEMTEKFQRKIPFLEE